MFESYMKHIQDTGFMRLVVLPFVVVLGVYLAPNILMAVGSVLFGLPLDELNLFIGAPSMIVTVIGASIFMAKISKISYQDLGINTQFLSKQITFGALAGFLSLALVALLIVLSGAAQLNFVLRPDAIMGLCAGLVFFIFQGTWEELMYRAYLMPHFAKKMGLVGSIILSSVIFTAGHALNPGMQALPVLNLFIAAVVFALLYYYTGSLVIVGMAHGLWNFAQGCIFGAEVSGNHLAYTIFKAENIPGMELISGGSFGFEGSILTSILGLIFIVLFNYLIRRKKSQAVQ